MIAQLDPSSLAPYLAGPGAAVVVLVLVLWGLYVIVVKHLIPLASRAIDRHLSQIDRLVEGQRDESKVRAVQFHPNLSYEDFVRGYRPSADGKLTIVDGVFLALRIGGNHPIAIRLQGRFK